MEKSLSALAFAQLQPFSCEVHPAVPLRLLQQMEAKDEGRRLAALLIGTAMDGLIEVKSCIPFYFQVQQGTKISFKLSSLNELVELMKEAQPKHSVVGLYVSGEVDFACVNVWGKVKSQHKGAEALLTMVVSEGVELHCMRTTAYPSYRLVLVQEVPLTLQVRHLDHIKPVQRLSQAVHSLRDQLKQCHDYLQSPSSDPSAVMLLQRCAKLLRSSEDAESEEGDIELVRYLSELTKVQLHVSDLANAQL